jgi:hypothetical protein
MSMASAPASSPSESRGYNLDIKNPHAVADDHGDPETLLANLAMAEAETAGLRDQSARVKNPHSC